MIRVARVTEGLKGSAPYRWGSEFHEKLETASGTYPEAERLKAET